MQPMTDTTLADAIAGGCDTVQLKPRGLSTRFCVANGVMSAYSRFYAVPEIKHTAPEGINCTLLGASRLVPLQCLIYDCWCVEDNDLISDLRGEPYRSRHVAAKIQCQLLGEPFKLIQNFPIAFAKNLWGTLNESSDYNGLIFRNSKEDTFQPVRVARWYAEMPRELV